MDPKPAVRKPDMKCGEILGARTAECAAICCCCPCAVIDILILTVVKVPAGLCRKAIRKRKVKRQKRMKSTFYTKMGGDNKGEVNGSGGANKSKMVQSPAMEVKAKEEEMWARFYSAGFWRSPSQKESN